MHYSQPELLRETPFVSLDALQCLCSPYEKFWMLCARITVIDEAQI